VQIDRLPSVLAIPLRDYLREPHPVLRVHRLCDAAEILARFLTIVSLAEVRRLLGDDPLPDGLLNRIQPSIERPTFGKWCDMLRVLVSITNRSQTLVVSEIPEFAEHHLIPLLTRGSQRRERGEETDEAEVWEGLLSLRNDLVHGLGITAATAQSWHDYWAPRFENALAETAFLEQIDLFLVTRSSMRRLVGPSIQLGPSGEVDWLKFDGIRKLEGHVVLLRRSAAAAEHLGTAAPFLDLWPLCDYRRSSTRLMDRIHIASSESPAIYFRYEQDKLLYAALGVDLPRGELDDKETVKQFRNLFRLDSRTPPESDRPQDFEEELRADAEALIGRRSEIKQAKEVIKNTRAGVIWVGGRAGMGKSFLMAKLAVDLGNDSNTCRIAWRFKMSDPARCNRVPFFRHAVERLAIWMKLDVMAAADPFKLDGQFGSMLQQLVEAQSAEQPNASGSSKSYPAKKRRVLIFLDGLDEIARSDPNFLEIPFSYVGANVVWVCAGRPEGATGEVFTADRCTYVFPAGLLPKMSDADIRAMLVDETGSLKYDFLLRDTERDLQGSGTDESIVDNPIVGIISKRADGLPIFLYFLIKDLLSGKLVFERLQDDLPESLGEYYRNLLQRLQTGGPQIGDRPVLLSYLITAIVWAEAPIHGRTLGHLLSNYSIRFLPRVEEESSRPLAAGLAAVKDLIRRGDLSGSPDLERHTWEPYHDSFSQYMRDDRAGDNVRINNQIRDSYCEMVYGWRSIPADHPAFAYVHRYGPRHLVRNWDKLYRERAEVQGLDEQLLDRRSKDQAFWKSDEFWAARARKLETENALLASRELANDIASWLDARLRVRPTEQAPLATWGQELGRPSEDHWDALNSCALQYCELAKRLTEVADYLPRWVEHGELRRIRQMLASDNDLTRRTVFSLCASILLAGRGYAEEAQRLWDEGENLRMSPEAGDALRKLDQRTENLVRNLTLYPVGHWIGSDWQLLRGDGDPMERSGTEGVSGDRARVRSGPRVPAIDALISYVTPARIAYFAVILLVLSVLFPDFGHVYMHGYPGTPFILAGCVAISLRASHAFWWRRARAIFSNFDAAMAVAAPDEKRALVVRIMRFAAWSSFFSRGEDWILRLLRDAKWLVRVFGPMIPVETWQQCISDLLARHFRLETMGAAPKETAQIIRYASVLGDKACAQIINNMEPRIKLVLEQIRKADLEDRVYRYRPGRGVLSLDHLPAVEITQSVDNADAIHAQWIKRIQEELSEFPSFVLNDNEMLLRIILVCTARTSDLQLLFRFMDIAGSGGLSEDGARFYHVLYLRNLRYLPQPLLAKAVLKSYSLQARAGPMPEQSAPSHAGGVNDIAHVQFVRRVAKTVTRKFGLLAHRTRTAAASLAAANPPGIPYRWLVQIHWTDVVLPVLFTAALTALLVPIAQTFDAVGVSVRASLTWLVPGFPAVLLLATALVLMGRVHDPYRLNDLECETGNVQGWRRRLQARVPSAPAFVGKLARSAGMAVPPFVFFEAHRIRTMILAQEALRGGLNETLASPAGYDRDLVRSLRTAIDGLARSRVLDPIKVILGAMTEPSTRPEVPFTDPARVILEVISDRRVVRSIKRLLARSGIATEHTSAAADMTATEASGTDGQDRIAAEADICQLQSLLPMAPIWRSTAVTAFIALLATASWLLALCLAAWFSGASALQALCIPYLAVASAGTCICLALLQHVPPLPPLPWLWIAVGCLLIQWVFFSNSPFIPEFVGSMAPAVLFYVLFIIILFIKDIVHALWRSNERLSLRRFGQELFVGQTERLPAVETWVDPFRAVIALFPICWISAATWSWANRAGLPVPGFDFGFFWLGWVLLVPPVLITNLLVPELIARWRGAGLYYPAREQLRHQRSKWIAFAAAASVALVTVQWPLTAAGPLQAAARCMVPFQTKIDRKITDCTDAIHDDPEKPDPYAMRCWAQLVRNELDKAITDCDEALSRGFNNPKLVLALRCEAHFAMGAFERAIGDCSKALDPETELKSSSFNAARLYLLRCDSYAVSGQLAAAINDCEEASRRGSIEGFIALAWWEIVAQRPKEALSTALKGLSALPAKDNVASYRMRLKTMMAHAYFFDGRFEAAITAYGELNQGAANDRRTTGEQIKADFQWWRKNGLINPDNENEAQKVEALFANL
jgi:tetratricopeptide (TPR) repeat protein